MFGSRARRSVSSVLCGLPGGAADDDSTPDDTGCHTPQIGSSIRIITPPVGPWRGFRRLGYHDGNGWTLPDGILLYESASMHARRPRKRKSPAKPPLHRPAESSRSSPRLQKVLAAAGLGSRRQCEELILAGRVEVDHEVVTELGTRVDPVGQQVRVDGVPLRQSKRVCYALNKPVGVVCTNRDPAGRPRAVDLVPSHRGRLFTVGRLDLSSQGLILVTNDGELANRLTHPRYGVEKTYRVLVAGHVTLEVVAKLRRGVHLAEGLAQAKEVRLQRRYKQSTILEMVLSEGRNREIRRLLARLGHKVLRLERIAIGPVRLGKLPPGRHRQLTRTELDALMRATRPAAKEPKR